MSGSNFNDISIEVVNHYNNLHRFLKSDLIDPSIIDFIRMEIAVIERDTGISPAECTA